MLPPCEKCPNEVKPGEILCWGCLGEEIPTLLPDPITTGLLTWTPFSTYGMDVQLEILKLQDEIKFLKGQVSKQRFQGRWR